jgi:nitrite reductase/ring-hydroxylating ferredoxin subunit
MPDFVTVAQVADLAPGQGRVVEVAGVSVALFNVGGAFYALDNTCPHRGGPLGEGLVEGDAVTCLWHNWSFRIATGEHVATSKIKVACYPVRVVGTDVQVKVT